jgi:hypothetical protein
MVTAGRKWWPMARNLFFCWFEIVVMLVVWSGKGGDCTERALFRQAETKIDLVKPDTGPILGGERIEKGQ